MKENTPRATYTSGGIRRTEGVKVLTGRALIGATKNTNATTTVRFGNFFSADTRPNIAHSILSGHQRRFFVTIDGIGTLFPDNRGFQIHVFMDAQTPKKFDHIAHNIYIPWIAVGI